MTPILLVIACLQALILRSSIRLGTASRRTTEGLRRRLLKPAGQDLGAAFARPGLKPVQLHSGRKSSLFRIFLAGLAPPSAVVWAAQNHFGIEGRASCSALKPQSHHRRTALSMTTSFRQCGTLLRFWTRGDRRRHRVSEIGGNFFAPQVSPKDLIRVVVWQFNVNEQDRVHGRPLHFPNVTKRWFYFDETTATVGSA